MDGFRVLSLHPEKPIITKTMNNGTIERFLESAALKLPAIIKPRLENRTEREVYEDYVLLSFTLPDSLSFDEFCTELGESFGTIELYRHIRSADTDYGHSICAYQEPGTGVMFQLCATTNSKGVITDADVKVFFSMERMLVELRDTLRRVSMQSGIFAYRVSEAELLSYFF